MLDPVTIIKELKCLNYSPLMKHDDTPDITDEECSPKHPLGLHSLVLLEATNNRVQFLAENWK